MVDSNQCEEQIRWVAAVFHEPDEFRRRAKAAATTLGPSSVETLAHLFHGEPSPPAELAVEFPGLGEWIAARQFAIFEIFYVLQQAALPVLRRVAFGEYDWTQANAIEILCRFAAEGIERDRILTDLKFHVPEMREEALLYAASLLLSQAKDTPQLAAIIEELRQVREFNEAVEELRRAGRA